MDNLTQRINPIQLYSYDTHKNPDGLLHCIYHIFFFPDIRLHLHILLLILAPNLKSILFGLHLKEVFMVIKELMEKEYLLFQILMLTCLYNLIQDLQWHRVCLNILKTTKMQEHQVPALNKLFQPNNRVCQISKYLNTSAMKSLSL